MREVVKVSLVAATASDSGRGDASEWDKRKGEVEAGQCVCFSFLSSGGRV
jgi:hypothetical protein